MLTENKFSKYLIYAIGEIILVVIGILIALQINNWNTDKQETKELHSYLSNIKKNLQEDLVNVETIEEWRDSSIMSSIRYRHILNKNELTFIDFTGLLWSSHRVFRDFDFISNKSGIETLKNSGFLRELNGTKLEDKLNKYYNVTDKILREEKSLNNTIESLQIFTYQDNILQQIFRITKVPDKEVYFSKNKMEILELLEYPSLMGAHIRNSQAGKLLNLYKQLKEIGNAAIAEIDATTKNNN